MGENLKIQLQIENDLIFDNENENANDNEMDCKVNEQHNIDRMIAKQIAMQEENADSDGDAQSDKSEKTKVIDLDYLLALSVEQEDIMNAVDIFEENEDAERDMAQQNVLITDSEILALLEQPGIDIEALLNTYPTLTRKNILDLIRKQKTRQNENK